MLTIYSYVITKPGQAQPASYAPILLFMLSSVSWIHSSPDKCMALPL